MAHCTVLKTVAGLHSYLLQVRSQLSVPPDQMSGSVGFVPTMGALHAGHRSLLERARGENHILVVSIFVNPLQFGPKEDLDRYPRMLEADLALCETVGVDAVFVPQPEMLLPTEAAITQIVPPELMTTRLCGQSRPGHFTGVATIVTKLLHLVQPDYLYLGRKDAQQLAIIQRVVADLSLPVTVIPCPTVREPSGLALSSRNRYLTPAEKQEATVIFRGLQQAVTALQQGQRDRATLLHTVATELAQAPNIMTEYIDLVDPQTLMPLNQVSEQGLLAIAAHVGSTRLIDNVLLDARQPILAVDGPAGAGKSTVTRQCAQRLGLLYLDTGAMYRAVTWLVLESDIPVTDTVAIAELASQCQLELCPGDDPHAPTRVRVNGQDVTQAIRSLRVTNQVSAVAAQPLVREVLVKHQQAYGKAGGVAMEGRDIGTHVFPDAGLKIFLTASVQERAYRRQRELTSQGNEWVSLTQLQQDIQARDRQDSQRTCAPLRKAPDAVEIVTDGLTIEQVIEQIVHLYQARFPSPVACKVL